MSSDKPVDVFDFREPVMIGDVCIGWTVNWTAYHAACDKRDAKPALTVVPKETR